MNSKNIELIKQSLSAAESSVKLAKQLLSELENGYSVKDQPKSNGEDLPGITGTFNGENMVSENNETFLVPANYASKSMLVVGDTLKLVEEGKNKEKRFKQIEHVKRHKSTGILTKKDGKWKVVTPEGSYKVLQAAVDHFGAEIGSEVTLHLPANNLTVGYGAIESVSGKEKSEAADKSEVEVKPQGVSKEKVEEPKSKTEQEVNSNPEDVKHTPKVEHKNEEKPKPEVKKSPEPKKEIKPVVVASPAPKKVEPPKPTTAPAPAPAPKPVVVPSPPPPAPLVQSVANEVIVAPAKVATPPANIEVAPEEDELL
jgi:hypothetical protein